MIYLDHNATTPLHPEVLEAMLPFLRDSFANPSSPHRLGAEARRAVEQARRTVADLSGFEPDEIVFCSGGTESDNLALRGAVRASRVHGCGIVASAIEHPAVLSTCRALSEQGCGVAYAPVDATGVVEVSALARLLGPETVLVSVMHANNETGVIQPIEEIAALTSVRGVLLHTDAVQTAGKLPGRLVDLGAELVTLSAHKFYGPKGIGVLCARRGTALHSMCTGGAQEQGLRAGTENVAAIVGLAQALASRQAVLETEAQRLSALLRRLEERILAAVPEARINGAGAPRVPGTSSLSFEGVDGEAVALGMDVLGVCVSTGSACSTGDPEPSHVLRAMGLSPRLAQGSIRVSLGESTTEQDVDVAAAALEATVARLRAVSGYDDAEVR